MLKFELKRITAVQLKELSDLLEDRSFNDPTRYFKLKKGEQIDSAWSQLNRPAVIPGRVAHLKKVVSQHESAKIFFDVTVVVATEVCIQDRKEDSSAKVPQQDLLRVMNALGVFLPEDSGSSR